MALRRLAHAQCAGWAALMSFLGSGTGGDAGSGFQLLVSTLQSLVQAINAGAQQIATSFAQASIASLETVCEGTNGSNVQIGVLEQLVFLSGSSTDSSIEIPALAIVFAVSELVVTAVSGAPSFAVGVSGDTTQFGSDLSVSAGSTNSGVIGPDPFHSATPIVITATSGSFTGGSVRISIQYMLCNPPTS